jgi:hypothetical protein
VPKPQRIGQGRPRECARGVGRAYALAVPAKRSGGQPQTFGDLFLTAQVSFAAHMTLSSAMGGAAMAHVRHQDEQGTSS